MDGPKGRFITLLDFLGIEMTFWNRIKNFDHQSSAESFVKFMYIMLATIVGVCILIAVIMYPETPIANLRFALLFCIPIFILAYLLHKQSKIGWVIHCLLLAVFTIYYFYSEFSKYNLLVSFGVLLAIASQAWASYNALKTKSKK